MTYTNDEIKTWMYEHLTTTEDASALIDEQPTVFRKMVLTDKIQPFYESKNAYGLGKNRLYLKEHVINLKDNNPVRPISSEEKELQLWMEDNLFGRDSACQITDQSPRAFTQSVATNKIIPFFESQRVKLYLKSDLEFYAKNKRVRKKKTDLK